VLSASGWFSGSNPFFSMIFDERRFTMAKAEKKFLAALNRSAIEMWRGGDWGMTRREFLDDLAWSGIHVVPLTDILPTDRGGAQEIIEDLAQYGHAYIPTSNPRCQQRRQNPPVGLIPGEVEKLYYQRGGPTRHPGPYQHRFGRGTIMVAMPNGDVVLRNTRGKKLWGRY